MDGATTYKLLYVDDEQANLRAFRNTFRRDFEIEIASSAAAALELLATRHFDIIITDQRMPQITGVEFLSSIMDTFPDIPPGRLIVSGYAPPEDIQEAYEKYHLFGFIAKPWKYAELKSVIIRAIEDTQYDRKG